MRTPKPILDRRRAVRVEEALPFYVGQKGYEAEVVSVNISHHGAYFPLDRDIPLMSKLDIRFRLSKTKRLIRAKGVVVRKEKNETADGYWIAVYFSDITPADQKALENFIQKRLGP